MQTKHAPSKQLVAKTIRFHALGGPEVLQFENLEVGAPAKGEVLIRIESVGLNHSEGDYLRDKYIYSPKLPSRLGYEAVGIVEAVGDDVDASLMGKRMSSIPVFSMNDYGVLAERAILPLHALTEAPGNLTTVQGASLWTSYLTAYGALVHFGKAKPGDFVIIRAASSSVGAAAIQIAKAQGAKSIATTRTAAKRKELLNLGADFVIASDEEDLPARVKSITSDAGARIILDPVGGAFVEKLAAAAGPEATLFLYGALSGEPTVVPMQGFGKGLAIRAYTFHELWQKPERIAEAKKYIYERVADGRFVPTVARTFGFSQAREAFEYLAQGKHVGKIVITFGASDETNKN